MPLHNMELVISCADRKLLPPGNTLEIKLVHQPIGVVHREYKPLDELKNSDGKMVVKISADIPEARQNGSKDRDWLVAWVSIAGFNEWFVMLSHQPETPPSRMEIELKPNSSYNRLAIQDYS